MKSPPPARSAEPSRKIAFHFSDFARADFFFRRKRQFFCEAPAAALRRLAGVLCQNEINPAIGGAGRTIKFL